MLADRINGHTPVAAVEIDPWCCGILEARARDGWFPGLRVHCSDISVWDPSSYTGQVDCLCAGWPCQGFSRLGDRTGLAHAGSGLWRHVVRIAGILRPDHLWLENSADIVSDPGFPSILADITGLGLQYRWGIVSAANAGAAHGRARWLLMADRMRDGLEGKLRGGGCAQGNSRRHAFWPTPTKSDAACSGRAGYMTKRTHSGTTLTDVCRTHLGATKRTDGQPRGATVLPCPEFAEWLLRLPIGFTRPDSKPSETAKTLSRWPSPGDFSEGQ